MAELESPSYTGTKQKWRIERIIGKTGQKEGKGRNREKIHNLLSLNNNNDDENNNDNNNNTNNNNNNYYYY